MKKVIRFVATLLAVSSLAASASASAFRPSVEQKGAPTVVVDTSAGTGASTKVNSVKVTSVADLVSKKNNKNNSTNKNNKNNSTSKDNKSNEEKKDENDEEVEELTEKEELIIETIIEAQQIIAEAENVVAAVPEVAEVLQTIASEVVATDLVVSDLFYVDLELEEEFEEGEAVTLTFTPAGVTKDTVLIVMVFVDGKWVVIDPEFVEITEDGEVKITSNVFGAIAFVTPKIDE